MPDNNTRFRRTVFASILLVWFVYFNREALTAPFGSDEMMNLAAHWRTGPLRLVYSQFLLWRDFHRPMGGVFYLPLFWKFGLNPLPYHAALLALLLVNAALCYRLARALGASEMTAWLAALATAYHAGLVNLYWDTAHVYDALCAIFFAAALLVYVRGRSQERALTRGETVAFFALLLGALNSKEIAITLPAVLVGYELFYHPRARSWTICSVAAVVCAVCLWGRVVRGLIHQSAYAPAPSWGRVVEFQQHFWRDLPLLPSPPGWVGVILLWALVSWLAFRRDRPILRLCWLILVIAPIPLELLEGRGTAALAVPFIGWSIFAAVVLVDSAWLAADLLKDEPPFQRLSRAGRFAAVIAAALLLFAVRNRAIADEDPQWKTNNGRTTMAVIEQFRAVNPHVQPHSTVVFLNDPFDGFDMALIAELWFRDRTINIRLNRITPFTEPELARADTVFDWRDGKLQVVRGATSPTR